MAGVKGRSGTNKGKDKPFHEALRMEVLAAGDDLRRLRRIASKLLDAAESGDVTAIREVADRLDGKPIQALKHGGDEDNPIVLERIERVILDPANRNPEGV